jgi:hypothetical protein
VTMTSEVIEIAIALRNVGRTGSETQAHCQKRHHT